MFQELNRHFSRPCWGAYTSFRHTRVGFSSQTCGFHIMLFYGFILLNCFCFLQHDASIQHPTPGTFEIWEVQTCPNRSWYPKIKWWLLWSMDLAKSCEILRNLQAISRASLKLASRTGEPELIGTQGIHLGGPALEKLLAEESIQQDRLWSSASDMLEDSSPWIGTSARCVSCHVDPGWLRTGFPIGLS